MLLLILVSVQFLSIVSCTSVSIPEEANDQAYLLPSEQYRQQVTAYPIPDSQTQPVSVTMRAITPTPEVLDNIPVIASDETKQDAIAFFDQYLKYAISIDDAAFSPQIEYYGCVNSNNGGVHIAYVVNAPLDTVRSSVQKLIQNEQWNYQEGQEVGDGQREKEFNGIMWSMSAEPSVLSEEQILIDISALEYSSITSTYTEDTSSDIKKSDMRVDIRYIENITNYNDEGNKALINTCNGEWWLAINP